MRALVGVLIGSVLLVGCGSGSVSSTSASSPAGPASLVPTPSAPPATPTTRPTSRPTPSPLGPPPVDIGSAGALLLREDGRPDWLALAGGSAWGAGIDGIRQMDGTTGTDKALVPVTSVCTAMDVGFGSLWAADCEHGALVRIDPSTGKVAATYPLKGGSIAEEGSVGVGEGAVWVASSSSSLVRIDPKTGTQTSTPLPVPGAGVRAGLGSVWVTAPLSGQVLRVDPKDGSVIATITAGREPRFLTVGGDSVWVQNNGDGTVTRIGADGTVTATIAVSLSPVDGGDIAFGGGFVWPRISSALIVKLDGTTGELLATYGPASGSGSVAADADAAWISAHDVASVWRLPLR
jgi:virginiamycin B lyase